MNSKAIFLSILSIFLSFMIVFQACNKDEESSSNDPSDTNPDIPTTTKVIQKQIWESNLIEIDSVDYVLTFNQNALNEIDFSEGDYIVCEAGNGLLRKVKSISQNNNEIVVQTSFANLTEVINNGETSFNTILSQQKISEILYKNEGIQIDTSNMKNTENTYVNYTIDLYLDPSESIRLHGDFSLLSDLSGQLEIGGFPPKVRLFEIAYEINQELNLNADFEIEGDRSYEKELAKVNFQPIIAMISGVPVVLVPQLEISAGIEANLNCNVYTGVSQNMDYTIGLKYDGSSWNGINEFDKNLQYTTPQLSCSAEARAFIRPEFKILIYNIVSPYLYGEIYGTINANTNSNPWWDLYGGVELGIGVNAEILGHEIFDYYTNPPLISYQEHLASASPTENNPPDSPDNESPDNGSFEVSVNKNLSWTCTDPEGDELYYNIYFGTSSNPPLVEEYFTSTSYSPGSLEENTTYYWNIKAYEINNNDNQSQSPVWSFTTGENNGGNTPPTAQFTVSPSSGTTSTIFSFDASASNDNEDPTNSLQIRWDFDGNGSWDTDWNTDKTENHQYSSEATYEAKLEVKDTEGLINQFSTSIIVNNGGTTGTFTDPRDGQTYAIVEIGTQTWFAENLNYEMEDSWCYDNNPANCGVYGRLYTWDAAMQSCPIGWHLPSDEEWKTMEMTLGMSQSEADNDGWRGTYQGEQLKSVSGWESNGNGSNSSGFNALPSGIRSSNGSYYDLFLFSYWWSSTEFNGSNTWTRGLYFNEDRIYRRYDILIDGRSVRCIKDY